MSDPQTRTHLYCNGCINLQVPNGPAAENNGERRERRLQSFLKEMTLEQEGMRKEMEEKKKKMIQCEREKEIEIQDLLRKVEEQKAELQRLSDETEKAELELQERYASEAEEELQLSRITAGISQILERVAGPGSSSKVKDPIEQLEVIRQFHQFLKAADESDEDQQEEPSKTGQM